MFWTEVRLWVAVTIEAPAHAQWFFLINHLHLVDATVATYTPNTSVEVSRVIKINIIRKVMDANPLNWGIGFPALVERLQLFAFDSNL